MVFVKLNSSFVRRPSGKLLGAPVLMLHCSLITISLIATVHWLRHYHYQALQVCTALSTPLLTQEQSESSQASKTTHSSPYEYTSHCQSRYNNSNDDNDQRFFLVWLAVFWLMICCERKYCSMCECVSVKQECLYQWSLIYKNPHL